MTLPRDDAGCAEGLQPLFRTRPFLDATGPYFYKPKEDGFVVGLRVQDKHTRQGGVPVSRSVFFLGKFRYAKLATTQRTRLAAAEGNRPNYCRYANIVMSWIEHCDFRTRVLNFSTAFPAVLPFTKFR